MASLSAPLKIAKNSTWNLDIFAFTYGLGRGGAMGSVHLQNNLQVNLQEINLHECASPQKYTFNYLLVDSSPPWSCSRFSCFLLGICSVSQQIPRSGAVEGWGLAGGSSVFVSPACWAGDLGCRSEIIWNSMQRLREIVSQARRDLSVSIRRKYCFAGDAEWRGSYWEKK